MKERMAVLHMSATQLSFLQVQYSTNGYFIVENNISESINLAVDINRDGYIKPLRIEDTINLLKSFQSIIKVEGITHVVCIADNSLKNVRNQLAFFDEIYKTVYFDFVQMDNENIYNSLHNAVLYSMALPKGIIVNIEDDCINIVKYNRRTIVDTITLDVGTMQLSEMFICEENSEERMIKMTEYISNQFKNIEFLKNIEEDYEIIGIGSAFENVGKLSRKALRYSLDLGHNYVLTSKNFLNIFNLVKSLDLDRTKKLKGISSQRADLIASSVACIRAFYSNTLSESINISTCGVMYGTIIKTMFNNASEKPLVDVLGYSLSALGEFYDNGKNIPYIYDTAVMLYRQLKVLHKLSKGYVKILRIAASLCLSGKRISFVDHERSCFHVVLNSNILGATHKEIILAAFAASGQNVDDISLPNWVKYKDIIGDEDIENIKKLSIIIKMSIALCSTGEKNITSLSCDILGDTVILKTEAVKNIALELSQASLRGDDFKKVFKKNLQIL